MRNPFGPAKPPDGHPELNAWLMHTASHHEAAHAVAAYRFRYPFHYVELQSITDGQVGEKAHFVQDLDAVQIAYAFLDRNTLSSGKAIVWQYTILEIAKATNVVLNGIDPPQAALHAQADKEHQDEMFARNPGMVRHKPDIIRSSTEECRRLMRDQDFQTAVKEVADLLVRHQLLTDGQVTETVESVTSSRFRPGCGEPPHAEIQDEAFYLYTRKDPPLGPLGDWLSAERGLRFATYASS
jgi:hypothetical protein